MSVELRPFGVTCNIQCKYCYQQPQRDAGNLSHRYDIEKMKAAVEAEGQPFTLFGGEPLLMPIRELEDLWSWGLSRFGRNSVQTNGTLISEEHIRLFHAYKVAIGVSIDGPGELNDARWHGSARRTRESTAKTEAAIERLCREGLTPSVIVTLHQVNASAGKLPQMLIWVRALYDLGVRKIRLHLLESESAEIRAEFALTEDENLAALNSFLRLEQDLPGMAFDLFPEMRRLLTGDDRVTSCVWYACDPYTTRAVRGVEGQGQRSNCGRTNKDGIDFVKAAAPGYERYIALYHTPQEAGGCKSCRFFLMCRGQCPGTAIDGDWRNRSEHCGVWMSLYETLEKEMIERGEIPLSLDSRRDVVERTAVARWASGKEVSVAQILGLPSAAMSPAAVSAQTPGADS